MTTRWQLLVLLVAVVAVFVAVLVAGERVGDVRVFTPQTSGAPVEVELP